MGDAERSDLLDRRCAGDPELRALVTELLRHAAATEGFLSEPPAPAPFQLPPDLFGGSLEGLRLGAFEVEGLVGWGGLGVVYRGRRVAGGFQQKVAIKLLMDAPGRELTGALEREREILASLDHPGIARVLDGGTAPDGRPYLVMELVDGVPVTEYCDEVGAGIRKRLRLFLRICEAVAGAHARAVVHRDLKPSNILVTREGDPKLLDFGIARFVDPPAPGAGDGRSSTATLTRTGLRALSPAYASPEQVRGEPVSIASDVFQLGTLLYELLTGGRPCEGAGRTPADLIRAICEVDPPLPSEVVRSEGIGGATRSRVQAMLRGDLDTIIRKALRKEPRRRYGTVTELADDIRRHLDGLPILARPPSAGYRLGKFARRHRVAIGLLFVMISGSAAGLGWEATHAANLAADRNRARFEAQRDRARFAAERAAAVPAVTTGSEAFAINDGGVIVGSARNSFGDERAARWAIMPDGSVSGPEDLGFTADPRPLPGTRPYSRAHDINNEGLIVGYDARGRQTRAYVHSGGQARPLTLPEGTTRSSALRVSDRGWVVGEATFADGGTEIRRALVWLDPLNPREPPVQLPPPPGHQWSAARWINSAGVVIGWSDRATVRWRLQQDGTFSGPEPVAGNLIVRGMNEDGVFVGETSVERGIALLGDSMILDLPPLDRHERSFGYALNEAVDGRAMVIVGTSRPDTSFAHLRGVAWNVDSAGRVDGPVDLGLIDSYAMSHAMDVNSLGLIAGFGSNDFAHRMAVLWRPLGGSDRYEAVPLGTFGPGPTASLVHFCEGASSCSFADTSVPGNSALIRWSWTSGAGEASDEQETIFSYPASGRYTSTLRVTDLSGRTDSAQVKITCTRRPWGRIRCR